MLQALIISERLPTLTENIEDIAYIDDNVILKDKITILGFLGSDLENKKGIAFNLNQKIYKRFYEFNDFQFVMLVPKGNESKVAALKSELGNLADVVKWKFAYGDEEEIQQFFKEP